GQGLLPSNVRPLLKSPLPDPSLALSPLLRRGKRESTVGLVAVSGCVPSRKTERRRRVLLLRDRTGGRCQSGTGFQPVWGRWELRREDRQVACPTLHASHSPPRPRTSRPSADRGLCADRSLADDGPAVVECPATAHTHFPTFSPPHFQLAYRWMSTVARSTVPDAQGHFGPYGGRFVPETLMHPLQELEEEYFRAQNDPEFQKEFEYYL